MADNNATILNAVWLNATNDYQQRIPQATQTSIASTQAALFDPMNRRYWNQFVDILVNRIGATYVHSQEWSNPLAGFKSSKMLYGSTEQEIATAWVKAHSYVDDAEDVFKMERPENAVWYHSQNRRDRYDIAVVRHELMTAFDGATGIANYFSSVMQVPINSDNYDEYRIMMQLIAFYEQNIGFYKHHLSGAPSDETTGREFLKAIRTYTDLLQFPRTQYNGVRLENLPVFAKPSELILLVTPEISASVDVDTLAPLFHLEKAEIAPRKIIVDEFPFADDDCVALLTTVDFFRCRDTLYETDSVHNAKTLGDNYFLHHWGIYSVSPFVPAIMFTTADVSGGTVVTQTVTGVTVSPTSATVEAGGTVELTTKLTGSLTNADGTAIKVAPDSCTYELTALSGTDAYKLPAATYVDDYGVLHVSKSVKSGVVITVNVTSTYDNPSGTTKTYTAKATVNVK